MPYDKLTVVHINDKSRLNSFQSLSVLFPGRNCCHVYFSCLIHFLFYIVLPSISLNPNLAEFEFVFLDSTKLTESQVQRLLLFNTQPDVVQPCFKFYYGNRCSGFYQGDDCERKL
jgi:hypothetical protein